MKLPNEQKLSPFDMDLAREQFLAHLADDSGYSELTVKAYRRDLGRFVQALRDYRFPTDIREIKTKHVQVFANSLAQYAPATIRRVVYTVSSLFAHLQRTGLIDANPAAAVLLPTKKQLHRVAATPEQCRAILEAASIARERALMLLLMTTGLHRAEILALDVADLSADVSQVTVNDKRRKTRVLPLPEQTRQCLGEYLASRNGTAHGGPLFINQAGNRIAETTIRRLLHKLLRKAGLADSELTLHSFRHSYAAQLVSNGADIKTVQELLGHADMNTTAQYLETSSERKRQAVECLPQFGATTHHVPTHELASEVE